MAEPVWTFDFFSLEFTCPKCGSHYFGSEINSDWTLTRHCHGVQCNYSWDESQDKDHFHPVKP